MSKNQINSNKVIFIQGCLMVGVIFAPMITGYRFEFPNNLIDWLGLLVSAIGTILVSVSTHALRNAFTIRTNVKEATKLVLVFPFSISRNPMYVGGLIMCFSWSLLQRSFLAGVFSFLLALVLHIKIKIEEKNLELSFGQEYLLYKKNVRRYL